MTTIDQAKALHPAGSATHHLPPVDAVVVGARPAGAGTAMLLARRGHRVVVMDRMTRGDDTLSTHALMRAGVDQLARWGLLREVIAAGTPELPRVTFDYAGTRIPVELDAPLFAPRRTVLDRIIADAAVRAGAQVQYGVTVQGLLTDPDGTVRGVHGRTADGARFRQRARIVIGADGVRSHVARQVAAPATHVGTHATAGMYTYFRGITPAPRGLEWIYSTKASAGLIPTNDGNVGVFVSTNRDRFLRDFRGDRQAAFDRLLLEASPQTAQRLRSATRVAVIRGFAADPGWLRRPYGAGWALVGDAGSRKDPISAHGIAGALRDAELLARAVDAGLAGASSMEEALAGYERTRNELSLPLLQAADAVAGHDWTIETLQTHHFALSGAMKVEAAHLRALHDDDPFRATQRQDRVAAAA